MLIVSTAQSQSINIEESTKPGDKLIIRLNNLTGRITIEGWDKNSIQINGSVDSDDENAARLKKIDNGFRLQMRYASDYYDDERVSARLTIKVPKKYDIYLRTQTDLKMSDIEGEFEISVANENAELNKLNGRAEISVANGTLDISNSKLSGTVHNVNGDLTVKNTDLMGEVSTTNAKMRLSRAPEGLDLRCTNGEITIESANKFIVAETVNASLRIGELNGRLEFESTNGSVEAKMTGDSNSGNHSVEVKTLNGSVDLSLSANFSMDFDVVIREENNRRRSRPYKAESDFPEIKIKKEDFGDGDYEVTAVGKIANGKNKAKMKIINGNVNIRKY
ncbi:MAG: hypothetical protein KDD94_10025 [Calditrichaeota bacterium]|nr:hypothetical protein [Calditrichota bacterium]